MSQEDRFYIGPDDAPHRYRLINCLGAGGEGEVWAAEQELSARGRLRVAVKILSGRLGDRTDESWQRHIDVLRSVSHPALVRVREAFVGPRRHRFDESLAGAYRYVVMDLVNGTTLRDWLDDHPELTVSQRLQPMRDIASALDEMHSGAQTAVPVAHGDVKPGNIILRADGSAVLVDPGLMRIADGTAIVGLTPPYAAPELSAAGPTSAEADRFAYAATLVHLLLGQHPPVRPGGGPDLDRVEQLLAANPLTAHRHALRLHLLAALRADPADRPHPLTTWLAMLTESLSQVTVGGDRSARPADPAVSSGAQATTTPIPRLAGSSRPGTAGPAGRAKSGPAKWGPAKSGPRGSARPSATRRWVVLAAAATAVVLATGIGLVIGRRSPEQPSAGAVPLLPPCSLPSAVPSGTPASPGGGELLIFASQEKSTLLAGLARDYGARQADGQCLTVRVEPRNSGKIMRQLTAGWRSSDGPAPDVWSPASAGWLTLARDATGGKRVLPAKAESLFTTPVVIGMPKPMADVLTGARGKDIGWGTLAELAADRAGWGTYGHPEWGPFVLGKTNPNYSSSGFTATLGAYTAATGRSADLTEGDVDSRAAREFVQGIERSVVHYGDTTLTFLANLRRADDQAVGKPYISAVAVEENSLVGYNLGYPCGAPSGEPGCARKPPPRTPLVAVYPREGTLYSEHPYVKVRDLSPAKDAVADDFLRYVHSDAARDRLAAVGFRTFDGKPTASLVAANGVQPAVPVNQLVRPPAAVMRRVLAVWPRLRKPANVLVVIDSSGSMNQRIRPGGPAKLALVKQAKDVLTGANGEGFDATDRVGLWKFAESIAGPDRDHQQLVPVAPMTPAHRADLDRRIQQLTAGGGTGLFNTVDAAVAGIRRAWNPDAINAVVVLSDGKDEAHHGITRVEDLLTRITPGDRPVRVFTIAYGRKAQEADEAAAKRDGDDKFGDLEAIANETEARRYRAYDATTIRDVLIDVISNF